MLLGLMTFWRDAMALELLLILAEDSVECHSYPAVAQSDYKAFLLLLLSCYAATGNVS